MDWIDVLLRTSVQSLFSTVLALVFGFFLALLLLSEFSLKLRKVSVLFLLWPSLLPAYFWFMVTAFQGQQSVEKLIFVQVLMNMGWVAWRLQAFWSDQLSRNLELCYIEGTSWPRLLWKVLLPMSRAQLFHISISVFLFCFGNYSLAMLLAGPAWSLDAYLVQQWSNGKGFLPTFSIAAGLWLTMILIYWKAPLSFSKPQVSIHRFPMLKIFLGKGFLFLLLFTPLIFFYFFFHKVAWRLFFHLIPFEAMFDSALVGLITGWFLLILGATSLWAWSLRKFNFILSSMISPPVAFLGLVLSLLEWRGGQEVILMGLGFALLLWPLLYRVFVAPSYGALLQQIQTAEVCGSSKAHTFFQILLPQMSGSLFSMAALGAFWSIGDFSLANLLAYETRPLARLIFEKLGRYEMELAHSWFLWLLITAFIVALFFIGCAYVANRKPQSSVR